MPPDTRAPLTPAPKTGLLRRLAVPAIAVASIAGAGAGGYAGIHHLTAGGASPVTVRSAQAANEPVAGGPDQLYVTDTFAGAPGGAVTITLAVNGSAAPAAQNPIADGAVCQPQGRGYWCSGLPVSFVGAFRVPVGTTSGVETVVRGGAVVARTRLVWGRQAAPAAQAGAGLGG